MSDVELRATADVPPDSGEFCIRNMDFGAGVRGPMFLFGCPRGRGTCGVPLKPSPPNAKGCSWDWDGDRERPTLTPSINCRATDDDGKPAGGCGWHGFVTQGKLTYA